MIIRRPAFLLLASFLLCDSANDARAGGGSGSSQYFSPVQALTSYAASKVEPSSANLKSEHAGGQFAGGLIATTPTRKTSAGVVYTAKSPQGNGPLLFGFASAENYGLAAGGDQGLLYGANFLAPGAGANTVFFGSTPATGTITASNTTLKVTVPPGFDANGTSLGTVSVSVVNSLGADMAPKGFIYIPALVQESAAVLGYVLDLRFYAKGKKVVFFAGVPGPPLASPPIQGKLMLAAPFFQLLPVLPFVGTFGPGEFVLSFKLPPDQPALVGVTAAIQAIALAEQFGVPVATGSAFTNTVVFTITQ